MSVLAKLDDLISYVSSLPTQGQSPKSKFNVPTKRAALYEPSFEEILPCIEKALQSNFKNVSVSIEQCPDLSKWANLADKGICGNTRLADCGGVPYLFTHSYRESTFLNLTDIVCACDMKQALVIGAGAGSIREIGKNAELIPNVRIPITKNNTRYAKMITNDQKSDHENNGDDIPVCRKHNACECGPLANLFLSDGHHIRASVRTGKDNFVSIIRKALKNVAGVGSSGGKNSNNKEIGMGGVIRINKGKIRGHVMPGFMDKAFDWRKQDVLRKNADDWLYFYECGPDLIMFTCFLTDDPTKDKKLNLRLEHTHFYTLKDGVNEGGHYHYDTTPDVIEYEAYLNLAQYIYRIDDAFVYSKQKGHYD